MKGRNFKCLKCIGKTIGMLPTIAGCNPDQWGGFFIKLDQNCLRPMCHGTTPWQLRHRTHPQNLIRSIESCEFFQGWKRPEDSDLICGKEAFHKSILWFYDKKQNLFKAILPGSILNIKKVLLPAIPIDGESVVFPGPCWLLWWLPRNGRACNNWRQQPGNHNCKTVV